jgi:hypothetical protein
MEHLHFLFNGGALTKSNVCESMKRIQDCWRALPLVRVLGGCLPDMILPGALLSWRGMLVCAENHSRLRAILPDGWLPSGALPPAHRLMGKYQYTRSDAARTDNDLLRPGASGDSGLMIYSGQVVDPGAVFVHGFNLARVTEAEVGFVAHALERWQAAGATIGGNAAKGHGRLDTSILVTPEIDLEAASAAYEKYVMAVREEAVKFLEESFGKLVEAD